MLPFAGAFNWFHRDVLRITPQRVCALVLVALCVVAYAPYLTNPYVFDDHNALGNVNFIDYAFTFSLAPRWLPYATLAHTHVLTDGSIIAMRLGNLLLHAINVVLVFVLLRELCLASFTGQDNRRRDVHAIVVASVGAALLAVHPVAAYAVGYVVQRTILMSTLFLLLMLIAYWRWLQTDRASLWVWSAVWYFLSVFSKEHSVAAPAAALLLTLVAHRPSIALLRRLVAPFTVYAVIALLIVSMVRGVLGVAYEPYALDMIRDAQGSAPDGALAYPLSVVTQLQLYFKYLFLWLVPNVQWMSLDMREPLATTLFAWPYVGAALGIALYVVMAVTLLWRGGIVALVGWLLLVPFILFTTELSTIRVQEPFVLYRAYVWFPLFGALLPLALNQFNIKVTVVIMLPVLCVMMGLSWNRLQSLSHPLLTWEDAAKLLVTGREPGASRIYYNRALALSAKQRHQEAMHDLDRAVALSPKLAPVYFSRAQVHFQLKQYVEANQDMNEAIRLDPTRSSYYLVRSIVLKQLGRASDASIDLKKSCDMKDFMGCFVLGREARDGAIKP